MLNVSVTLVSILRPSDGAVVPTGLAKGSLGTGWFFEGDLGSSRPLLRFPEGTQLLERVAFSGEPSGNFMSRTSIVECHGRLGWWAAGQRIKDMFSTGCSSDRLLR
ncbi:MAG: hypothetical protein MK161_00005, partial [Pirellulales bacterium]|nr:hypothetical protein [Pirellulales bacterium]